MRTLTLDMVLADAERRGAEDGKAAGSWVIDGNTSTETALYLLRGIEDGDPQVLDALPCSPLSGEFADGLLPRDVLEWYEVDEDHLAADDILTAYEQGFDRGAMDEVQTSAWYAADCPPIERTS